MTPYAVPEGCCAAYYPECNPLIPLSHHAEGSKVPAAKSVPVIIDRQAAPRPFGAWNETLIDITMAASPVIAGMVDEALPGSAYGSLDDGSTLFSFRYPEGDFLLRFLLSFGPGIRILRPEGLRTSLRDASCAIADANCQ